MYVSTMARWCHNEAVLTPGSFLICLLGFRCMLRRIHLELEHGLGSNFTPSTVLLEPFNECVELVSRLTEQDCNGYFLICKPTTMRGDFLALLTADTAHILSSVTSSLTRIAMANSTDTRATTLLATLVRSLHRYQADYKWDIAIPAIRRAAAVDARLKSLGEHQDVALALRGGDTETPFDVDAALEALIAQPMDNTGTEPQFIWDNSGMDWNLWGVSNNDLNTT